MPDGGGDETPVEFEAHLLEVDFRGSVRTALDRATISGPHWVAGNNHVHAWTSQARAMRLGTGPYSNKPAVYLIAGARGADHSLRIKVNVTRSQGVSGTATLRGALGPLLVSGSCPTSVGEHTLDLQLESPPSELAAARGLLNFVLELTDMTWLLGAAFVEVFFVIAQPTASFRRNGVWAEALRFLFGRVGVSGAAPLAIAARVTRHCHTGHGLRYDTFQGAPAYFSASGLTFNMSSYLVKSMPLANCYDQASAVQTLCGAVGIAQNWLFLDPFGYIRTANLLGVGSCNNPFFGANEAQKVVPALDPDRTSFGNHAFVEGSGKIFDACAGPHAGEETRAEYIAASIDDLPALYPGTRPGRESDIQVFGIVEAT